MSGPNTAKVEDFSEGSDAAASDPRKMSVLKAFTEGYDAATSYPRKLPVSSKYGGGVGGGGPGSAGLVFPEPTW